MRLINHANLSFLMTRRTGLALEVDALPFSSDKISMMTDPASRSRSQSLHSLHGSQQRTSPDNSAQRRVSVESFSDQKHSQDSSSPRRSSRRISGAMYFSNFKRPNETKDNVQARKNTFESTYRLEPKTRFPEIKVKAVLNEVLEKLESHTYSSTHSPFLAKLLSTRVLENVKRLNIERYKIVTIVCLVTIGSKASQGLRIASRCLWNDQLDTVVSASFETKDFFAVGTVYGIYYE